MDLDVCTVDDSMPTLSFSDNSVSQLQLDDELGDLWNNMDSQFFTEPGVANAAANPAVQEDSENWLNSLFQPSTNEISSERLSTDCLLSVPAQMNSLSANITQSTTVPSVRLNPTQVLRPPHIKCEHSYSLHTQRSENSSSHSHHNKPYRDCNQTVRRRTEKDESDIAAAHLVTAQRLAQPCERMNPSTLHNRSLLSQHVKSEPTEFLQTHDVLDLPMTPPGSSGNSSDSDSGCSSPHHTAHLQHYGHVGGVPYPNFAPLSSSGVLLLTEEEKRTLVQEGYPIPHRLPLSKQEEKNLKKIRRKIKNKISAQESRRKKKEYLECLEKKVEAYSQDNHDLRKKVDNLENNNRSLLTQLHKLQALVNGKKGLVNTASASSGLMMLVLFFAVFFGAWAPSSVTFGYTSGPVSHRVIPVLPGDRLTLPYTLGLPSGPSAPHPSFELDRGDQPISTAQARSRLLLSYREEDEFTTWYEPWKPITPETWTGLPCIASKVQTPKTKREVNSPSEPSSSIHVLRASTLSANYTRHQ